MFKLSGVRHPGKGLLAWVIPISLAGCTLSKAGQIAEPAAPGQGSAGTQQSREAQSQSKQNCDPKFASVSRNLPGQAGEPGGNPVTAEKMKPYTQKIPGTDIEFDLVVIPGGTFTMGSPPSEKHHKDCEGPQVEVEISPFWMGKCEVTWDEYDLWALELEKDLRKLEGSEPTDRDKLADAVTRPTDPYGDMTFGMGREGYPAICMTQLAAKIYCKWLTAKTGRYYRLPTEAEWEYACRAGTSTAYSFGDGPEKLDRYAWYSGNSGEKYHKAGQKAPNPWGLHDMNGNVAEWVLGKFTPEGYKPFAGKRVKNPLVIPDAIYPRVVRGGSWKDDPPALRSAARLPSNISWKKHDPQFPKSIWYLTDGNFVGFRVVRPLKTPTEKEIARYGVDKAQQAAMDLYEEYKGF